MPAADPIAQLLAGTYRDAETGELVQAESQSVVIADSLAGREVEVVATLGIGPRVAVIADTTTQAVLGARVGDALRARYQVQSIVLDAPYADEATVARLLSIVEPGTDAVIAVGSGTLNDLSKMVGFERGIPQLVFATAPSMNGYTSVSASITGGGLKKSIRTRTPVGAFFDLAVIAAAPRRLVLSGLGDSASRATAQADWLLSHLLLDRPYRETPFVLLVDDERALFAQTAELLAGDLGAMRHLVRTLVLSGFGMTIAGGSFPASQGEHLLSHYIEMMAPPALSHAWFHGEQIGVCTVAMARLQDQLLGRDRPPVLAPNTCTRDEVIAHFGPETGDMCWRELEQKRLDVTQTAEVNARLSERWDEIRARITAVTPGAAVLAQVLASAGAPIEPSQLGWPADLWDAAMHHAREIRNRYTFLDVAADLRR